MSRTIRKNRVSGKPERDNYHRNTHTDRSCGHNGGCPWCASGRLFRTEKREPVEVTYDEET